MTHIHQSIFYMLRWTLQASSNAPHMHVSSLIDMCRMNFNDTNSFFWLEVIFYKTKRGLEYLLRGWIKMWDSLLWFLGNVTSKTFFQQILGGKLLLLFFCPSITINNNLSRKICYKKYCGCSGFLNFVITWNWYVNWEVKIGLQLSYIVSLIHDYCNSLT